MIEIAGYPKHRLSWENSRATSFSSKNGADGIHHGNRKFQKNSLVMTNIAMV